MLLFRRGQGMTSVLCTSLSVKTRAVLHPAFMPALISISESPIIHDDPRSMLCLRAASKSIPGRASGKYRPARNHADNNRFHLALRRPAEGLGTSVHASSRDLPTDSWPLRRSVDLSLQSTIYPALFSRAMPSATPGRNESRPRKLCIRLLRASGLLRHLDPGRSLYSWAVRLDVDFLLDSSCGAEIAA